MTRAVLTSWVRLREPHGTDVDTTWDEWFATFDAPPSVKYLGDFKHPGWSAAIFEPCERAKSNVTGLSALVLDYDSGETTLDSAVAHWSEWYGLIHTTRSHTVEAPRFRVVLPFTRIVSADEYEIVWTWAESIARGAGHAVDPATKDPSRYWYLPGSRSGTGYEFRRLTGHLIDPDPILVSHRYEEHGRESAPLVPVTAQISRYGTRALESACEKIRRAAKGQRNSTLNSEAFNIAQLVAGGVIDDAAARCDLRAAAGASGLDANEITATLGSAFSSGLKKPRVAPELRRVQRPVPSSPLGGTGTDGPAPLPVSAPVFKLGDHVELAAATRSRIETSPLTYDDGSFWRYDPACGVWKPIADEVIKTTVAGFSGAWIDIGKGYKPLTITSGACNGVTDVLRSQIVADPNHYQFRNARPGIAFRDRFVTVANGAIEFHPHSHEHLVRAGLPFDYDPLDHPQLDKFFADLFIENNGQPCADAADRIKLLQEFIGACLLGLAPSYQRCLVLYGTGNNGKSQVIDIAKAAFPDGTVVALPPQQWDERFRLPLLVGALANFVGELPNREIAASETFKGIVVGDPQTAERKNRDAFTFTPRCGNMFGANGLPTAGDVSVGFFRRFVILPLTRVFPESGAGVERDIGKRIAQEERQAIAAWAVEGAARLQRQGGYTIPASVEAIRDKWTRDSDSVHLWLDTMTDRIEKGPSNGLKFQETYEAYARWAKGLGFQPVNGTNFGRRYTASGRDHSVIGGKARYYIRVRESHET